MLTQSELKKLLSYDPETGDFIRLIGRRAGKKVGTNHGVFYHIQAAHGALSSN